MAIARALTTDEMLTLARPAARDAGIPLALVLAVAQRESEWKPWARRAEPHLGDASHGLMQMLLSTAQGAGYSGAAGAWDHGTGQGTGLYHPATNLRIGARILASLLSRANGDIERAVSAYNAGWGNAVKAAAQTRFCDQWKASAPASGRVLDRDCERIRVVRAGEWLNQPYVTAVMRSLADYSRLTAGEGQVGGVVPGGTGGVPQSTPVPSSQAGATFVVNPFTAIVAAVVGVIAWLMRGRSK